MKFKIDFKYNGDLLEDDTLLDHLYDIAESYFCYLFIAAHAGDVNVIFNNESGVDKGFDCMDDMVYLIMSDDRCEFVDAKVEVDDE